MTTASDSLPSLPEISSFQTLPQPSQTKILDLLFEPTPALHTYTLPYLQSEAPYDSYASLISTVRLQLHDLAASISSTEDEEEKGRAVKLLDDVLAAHPRLGEKKVESALSRAEQAAMNAASSGDLRKAGGGEGDGDAQAEAEARKAEEAEILTRLNSEYEEKFPGLRYVVFVAGRPRPVIFEDMRTRIAKGDIEAERVQAINAMCDIALDRVHKLGSK